MKSTAVTVSEIVLTPASENQVLLRKRILEGSVIRALESFGRSITMSGSWEMTVIWPG